MRCLAFVADCCILCVVFLCVVRCLLSTVSGFGFVGGSMFVVRCVLLVARCASLVVVVRGFLCVVACCLRVVACCLLFGVRRCSLHAVRCGLCVVVAC